MLVQLFQIISSPIKNLYNPTGIGPSLNGSALKVSDPEREKELLHICEGVISRIHAMDCSNQEKEFAIQDLTLLFPSQVISQAKINFKENKILKEDYRQSWY